jgi:hypothetical protein
VPLLERRSKVPLPAPDDYLRRAMVRTLAEEQEVVFELRLQFQEDPMTMPIEDASVIWSSEEIPVARLRLPRQAFDTPERDRLARELTINPLARPDRTPPTGQPEPRPPADLLRDLAGAPAHQRRTAFQAVRYKKAQDSSGQADAILLDLLLLDVAIRFLDVSKWRHRQCVRGISMIDKLEAALRSKALWRRVKPAEQTRSKLSASALS